MTFNIRYDNPDDGQHAWPNRKTDIVGLIEKYDVDILAVQEALKGQLEYLATELEDFRWMGVGRDDGREAGEYTAIFYKRKKYDVRDYGNFWLSETPDLPGSMGWDAACVRIATWARFRDRLSRNEFIVVNTHLDHMGSMARLESARLLRKRMIQLSEGLPVILAGDFNSPDTSAVYRELTDIGPPFLVDSKDYSDAAHEGPQWTFQGFSDDVQPRRIDYIFISTDFHITRHITINDPQFGKYPSDHLPVLIKFWL